MVDIPTQPAMTPEQAYTRLINWYERQARLNEDKATEHLERVALSAYYFPSPTEGVNRLDIGGGFDLKMDHKLNYKVLEDELDQVKAADIKKLKLPWDDLFEYKPTLKLSVYRKLTAEQKKFVDQILEIKDGSPQMHIVPRADRAGQEAHARAAELGNVAASDSQAAGSLASGGIVIVAEAEQAEPGNYFHDGTDWWRLNDDSDWEEVTEAEDIEMLNGIRDDNAPPTPTPPKRRGRKAAAK